MTMHRSRINGILIDCNVENIEEAARFWAEALGRPVNPNHPGTRGNYVMLEDRPDEISVQIQRVDHESRVHLDIETDDIPAEVARLEKLGAAVDKKMERWVVMRAGAGSASASYAFNAMVLMRTRTAGANGVACFCRVNSKLALYDGLEEVETLHPPPRCPGNRLRRLSA